MNDILKKDLKNISDLLEKVTTQGLSFLNNIDKIPTTVTNFTATERYLDEEGSGALNTLKEFKERFEPLIVASTGARYWGFVTGGSTPAAIAGDWLATVYDQNPQAASGQGDISATIELETIRLLLELFNLPNDFSGGFVTGATMSNFTCLAVARQWLGQQNGLDVAKDGVSGDFKILTAVPHSSAVKSLAMLGLGSRNFIQLKIQTGNRECINVQDLENQIEKLNGIPFILISSGGTVNTVDFDDFVVIKKLKTKYNFWWHIDAAFGAFAACSPTHKHLVEGWEDADSITIDGHKWLNVPYENAFYFIKNKYRVLQIETFQNTNAPYLGNALDNFSYLNFGPENSRRLKALPVWFTLLAYGKKGYQDIVENSINIAHKFGNFVITHEAFELLAPVRLNTVCFTLSNQTPEKVSDFLTTLNNRGKIFMTPTIYGGKKGIRAAFVNWRTSEHDIEIAMDEMKIVLKMMND